MFTEEQIKALEAPLDRANVKTRSQAGQNLSYIEAYHAETEANRIFGFGAWDRETEITHIGEREHDGKWRVYYRAKVRITVRHGTEKTVREGCGFGSGIDRDIGQAHESALKEAESDAEKRALKTFGNQFGQALYDKSQANVQDAPPAKINDGERDMIQQLASAAGVTLQKICREYQVESLIDLSAHQGREVMDRLRTTIANKKEAA